MRYPCMTCSETEKEGRGGFLLSLGSLTFSESTTKASPFRMYIVRERQVY